MVLATDLVVAGVHADLAFCGLDDVGYKAVMVTVSDLAAMGARPDHLLLSIAAPPDIDLDLLGAGVDQAAREVQCRVVGGDLAGSPVLVVSVAVSGSLRGPLDRGPLLRSGAGVGDLVYVTGPLGASAAGLRVLRSDRSGVRAAGGPGDPVLQALAHAHRRPTARISEGEVARLAGASACIDVSDGLAADIHHLALASAVGVALDALPVAAGATPGEAQSGGEDYELVITASRRVNLPEAFAVAGLRPPLLIGRCHDQADQVTLGGAPLPPTGWVHGFSGTELR